MDPQSLKGVLDAFGFQLPPVQINTVLLFCMVVLTYWTRRIAGGVAWPFGLDRILDTLLCWFGPSGWALLFLWATGPAMSWVERATWAMVYQAFGVLGFVLIGKRLLEAAWGPVHGNT